MHSMHRRIVTALATLLLSIAVLPWGTTGARTLEDVRRRTDMRVTQEQREAAAARMAEARAAAAKKDSKAKAPAKADGSTAPAPSVGEGQP